MLCAQWRIQIHSRPVYRSTLSLNINSWRTRVDLSQTHRQPPSAFRGPPAHALSPRQSSRCTVPLHTGIRRPGAVPLHTRRQYARRYQIRSPANWTTYERRLLLLQQKIITTALHHRRNSTVVAPSGRPAGRPASRPAGSATKKAPARKKVRWNSANIIK